MKKIISIIMIIALLAVSVAALAEGDTQASQPGGVTEQGQMNDPMMGDPNQGGRPGGRGPRGQAPGGEKPTDLPEMPEGEKPTDLPEMPEGEKPTDLPEKPEGKEPTDLPEKPEGEEPTDLPEKPEGEQPVMIDFDAMVTKGVISQETCDKIKAYMEEHKPADLPEGQPPEMTGEKPEGQTTETTGEKPADPPEGTAPAEGGLLADLLKDGVITQAEYDALMVEFEALIAENQ